MKQKIFSKPYNREFEVEICPPREGESADVQVIAHASLERIIVHDLKVSYDTTVVVGATSHSLVKCVMEDKNTGIRVCAHGETTKSTLTSDIGQGYPTRTAETRAFDAAAITLLGFEGKFYTDYQMSAESRISNNTAITPATVSPAVTSVEPETFVEDDDTSCGEDEVVVISDFSYEDEETYVDVPDVDDDVTDDTESGDTVETLDKARQTGEYRLESSSKKNQTLNEIFNSEGGKEWLDNYLGGSFSNMDIKKAIVAFYVANNIPGPTGEAPEGASKQKKDNALNGKNTFEKLAAELEA